MRRVNGMKRLFFSALAAIVFTTAGAFAQNDDYYIQLSRISMMEGNVGYQRVPDEEWTAASANMPLEPGDRIYTGRGGRVEIEFEEGSALRLAENTDIEILTLDEDFVQIRMLLGTASLTVEGGVDFEIGSPAAAFSTEANGIYRFEVAEDGRSEAIVRKGRLETVNNNFTRVTRNGDLIRVYPDATGPVVTNYNGRDAWDEWTDRRDADRRPSSAARRYIPNNVSIGVAELDRHGRWVYVTNYGWGWLPYSVASSWSPYSVGRWVYRSRFGWTWVSYETWGWLPYHYGRWYRDARFGWTWFPGESVTFRFWSPGLVVFYRGSGWVSWGPLGPGDYYDAAYYRYRSIYAADLARVRVLVARQPGNYINQNVRGAFQTVSMDHFRGVNSGGQNANARRNDISQPWRQGNLVRGGLDVSPARESFRPAPDRRGERPQAETNRTVVVRRTPPQTSGNNGRFSQVSGSPESPATNRANANRGDNNDSVNRTDRRPNESRPDSANTTTAKPSTTGRDRQSAPAQSNRPAPQQTRPSGQADRGASSPTRESGTPATGGTSSGGSDRQAAPAQNSRPTPQQTRPSGQADRGASPSTRENGAPATGGSSSGGSDRQAAPAQNSRPATQQTRPSGQADQGASSPARESGAPATGGTSSGGSDRQAAPAQNSRPATQQTRPSGQADRGASPSARESGAPATGGTSSGGSDRQAAPAQNSRPATQQTRPSGQADRGASPSARESGAPATGGSSSGGSDRQAAPAQNSRPAPQQTRPSGQADRGASPSARESGTPTGGGTSSGSRDRQASSALRSQTAPVPETPATRQNNTGSSLRNSPAGQQIETRPNSSGNSTTSRPGGRR